MNIHDTLIVSATRNKQSDTDNVPPLVESLKEFTSLYGDHNLEMNWENTDGLPAVYNKYLTKVNLAKYSNIIYVHDDVYIDDLKCFEKIEKQFDLGYSVVGLAGGSKVKIKQPALWHYMSDRESQHGAVTHIHGDVNYVTVFGTTPARALIMDGLFLAIDCKKFLQNPVTFDERFKFHHYDIDFCLQCNKNKHKLVIDYINVIHKSHGLLNMNDEMYNESEKLFLEKYAKT